MNIYRTGSTPTSISFIGSISSTADQATNSSSVTIRIEAWHDQSVTTVAGTATTAVTVQGESTETKSQTTSYTLGAGDHVTIYQKSFTVQHDLNGDRTIAVGTSISGGISGIGQEYFTLDHIDVGAIPMISLNAKTETSATIKWLASAAINYLWYKVNSGNWVANGAISGTTGAFTITGLSANTAYSIKIKVRTASNGIQTESAAISVTTYSYPYATSMPNFSIGNKVTIGIYNPLGRTASVKLLDNTDTSVGSLSTSGTSVSGYNGAGAVAQLYATIPSSTSGQYKIQVTYGGHTETRTGGYYSIVAANCIPESNTPTYQDSNSTVTAVTGDNQIILQGKSTAQISVTGLSAKNSASIASVSASIPGQTITLTISGTAATGTFSATQQAADTTCTVTITDSRGVTATKTVTLHCIPYTAPQIQASARRHNNYYTDTDILAEVTFTAVGSNAVTITYSATGDGGSASGTLTNGTTSTVQLDNEYDWNIYVVATDSFSLSSTIIFLAKGTPIIFFDRDLYSVGINCFPRNPKTFEVDGAVLNRNVVTLKASGATTSGTSSTKITLSTEAKVGDQLTLDNGGAKVGAKIKKVLVSANVTTLSPTAGTHTITIKNGNTAISTASRTLAASLNLETISITPVLTTVAANDNISVYVQGFASTESISVELTVEAMA